MNGLYGRIRKSGQYVRSKMEMTGRPDGGRPEKGEPPGCSRENRADYAVEVRYNVGSIL